MSVQDDVTKWVITVLGDQHLHNKKERAYRFLEEALELAQALGVTPDEVTTLRDYTFSRPVGDINQEIAGCAFTLMALGSACGFTVLDELNYELARVSTAEQKAKIRAKAHSAPEGSLPQ